MIACAGLSGSAAAATPRHYEQASPADKSGDVVGDGLTTVASSSGDAVAFSSRAQFAGAVGSGVSGQTQYVARRGAGGWSTVAITPMPRPDALQTFFGATKLQVFSTDLSTALLWAYDLPAVSGDAAERNSIYVEDTATRTLEPVTVSQQDPLGPFDFLNEQVWGVSDDARHVAFATFTRLLPEAAPGALNLYQWDDGVLTMAGVLPDGTVPSGGATVFPDNYRGAMSADGSRLAFSSPVFASDAQLYLWIDGRRTVWVSQPEGSDQSTPTGVVLQGMTRDGKYVFFGTDAALVDSDTNGGPDLYRYTDSADPARDGNLTMISDSGNVPPNNLGGSLIGFSADGERVYYHTINNELVLWDHGRTRVLVTGVVRSGTAIDRLTVTASEPGLGRVTPDGAYMAFLVNDAFDDVHGPTGDVTNRHYAMYVYSLRDDTAKCVSCPSGAVTSDATVRPTVTAGNPTIDNVSFRPSFLSDDGQVFFSTSDALVPQDRNGVQDVYEYDGATGELVLLSTGKGSEPAMFGDASASGDDVFIVTRQNLASSDRDELVDLYDVRVGPAPPEPRVEQQRPCEGEGCQLPPSSAPDEDALGSLLLDDDASGPLAPRKALAARQRVTFRGASGSLGVRLLAPGTLQWSGRGLRAGAAKRGRGTARISVRLTRRARAQLQARGTYRTTLRLTLRQSDGATARVTTRVTFRTPAKKGR